jgi:alanine dehydrogenase
LMHEEQVLFTYLHLAPALELTRALLERRVLGVAYETVEAEDGTLPAEVAIIGGGTVGVNAARVALGMGAHITILDIDTARLRYLETALGGRLTTVASDAHSVERAVVQADLVIGALLRPGAKAAHMVTKPMIAGMRRGSVVVDVAIDQGGCVEGSRPTSFR